MRRKICFIINPISGVGKHKIVEPLIGERFQEPEFETHIWYTTHAKHAVELSQLAAKHKFETVVAVGGDGSVNEISRGLIHTPVKLGIVPCGSGNGFARHLEIPVDIKKSLDLIHQGNSTCVDTLSANKISFVNIAGLGFDAHVAHLFAESKVRGFKTYVKLVLREFFTSGEEIFVLEDHGKITKKSAFMLSIANASQYGNNASISPFSMVNDGKMEVCALKKIPIYLIPILVFSLFNKRLRDSSYYSVFSTEKFKLTAATGKIHLDGEPIELSNEIEFEVNPMSLNVIVPNTFHA